MSRTPEDPQRGGEEVGRATQQDGSGSPDGRLPEELDVLAPKPEAKSAPATTPGAQLGGAGKATSSVGLGEDEGFDGGPEPSQMPSVQLGRAGGGQDLIDIDDEGLSLLPGKRDLTDQSSGSGHRTASGPQTFEGEVADYTQVDHALAQEPVPPEVAAMVRAYLEVAR